MTFASTLQTVVQAGTTMLDTTCCCQLAAEGGPANGPSLNDKQGAVGAETACLQAIDLIDEAGSRVRLQHAQLPEEARELDKELRALTKEKSDAVRGQDFEKAGQVRPQRQHASACNASCKRQSGLWAGRVEVSIPAAFTLSSGSEPALECCLPACECTVALAQ